MSILTAKGLGFNLIPLAYPLWISAYNHTSDLFLKIIYTIFFKDFNHLSRLFDNGQNSLQDADDTKK